MSENNLSNETKINLLHKLIETTKNNELLPLYTQESFFVPGMGPVDADIMMIGEAPGREESLTGKPFVGRSGKLLSQLLDTEGFDRSKLFITNVVKYRPPNNRTPTYQESMAWAKAYLREEIKIISPKIIITVGACATKIFLGENISISKVQGKVFNDACMKIMPIYHPAYLLRNPAATKYVQEALRSARAIHTEIVHNFVHNLFITCS